MADTDQEELGYEDALKDNTLISAMYHSLIGLGEKDVSSDPKEILDTFLTKKRYFDTNTLSTAKTALDVRDMNEDTKKVLAYALSRVEAMPSLFSSKGAPAGKAIADYALAGVTDPVNLLSAVTSFFTAGASGAALQSGKVAAQQGVKELLKSRLKAAVSEGALKSLAAEGAVTGVGGAAQNLLKQDTEQELGLRSEKDYTEAALQGLLEGVATPLTGVGASITGSVVAKTGKDLLDNIPAASKAVEWTKRNFLPSAGLDQGTLRIMERNSGEVMPTIDAAIDLRDRFKGAMNKAFGDDPDPASIKLINDAMINDPAAVAQITAKSPELAALLPEVRQGVDEQTAYASKSNLSSKAKGFLSNNGNYLRNVPEAYYVFNREPFEKFLTKNPTVLDDLEQAILADAKLPRDKRSFAEVSDKFIDKNGNILSNFTQDDIKKYVREYAKKRYEPTRRLRSETGTFGPREKVPDVIKTLIGYNNRPELRIADTAQGIMSIAAKANLADDLGAHAVQIGRGVVAKDEASARAALNKQDVVRLVGGFDKKYKPLEKQVEPISLPLDYVNPKVRDYWVTKDYADQIKTLTSNTPLMNAALGDGALSQAYKSVLTFQNFLKAGKTVYDPLGNIRNLVGAGGYTWASGNMRGIADAIREVANLKGPAQRAAWNQFESLGLKGSSIELNQVLRRFGDLAGMDDDSLLSNVLYLGKAGKKVREFYGAVDDFAKFGVFRNELRKSEKIYNSFSPQEQARRLNEFRANYNKPQATVADYLAEQAANKTSLITPIYDRIPRIFEKTRAVPIIGSFVAYPAERMRNVYNILKTSTDELREGFETGNKELMKAGAARLAQFYTAQGALYTAAYAANEMMGASQVVESLRRSMLPDYNKDNPILITGKNKDGYYKMVDLGSINPDQQILDVIAPLMLKASRGEDVSKDIDKALIRMGGKVVEPYLSPSLITQAATDLVGVAKGDMSKLDNLVKTLQPGAVRMAYNMAADSGALDKMGTLGSEVDRFMSPRRFGEQKDRADDFFDFMKKSGLVFPGMREEVIDPRKTIGFALNNLKKNTENSWGKFRKETGSLLSDPTASFNPQSVLEKYEEAMRDQFVFQQGVRRLYLDAQDVVPNNKTKEIMKSFDLRGVTPSKRDEAAIFTGQARPLRLSQDEKFWVDLNKSYESKSGENNWEVLRALKQKFLEIEKNYMNADLNKNPPRLKFSSGSKE